MQTFIRSIILTVFVFSYVVTATQKLDFHASSFLVNKAAGTVPHGIAVPVTIQLLDDSGNIDTASSVLVTATSSAGTISGNTAVVSNGIAKFMITFTSCKPSALTFTAVGASSLQSGVVSVKAVPNSEIMFDAQSFLQSGRAATVVAGVKMSAFKINLYDSCGVPDTSMTGLTIRASSNAGTLSGETTATFTNGVALFTELSFVEATSNAAAQLTFTVDTAAPSTPSAGHTLVTGPITVEAQASHNFGMQFKKSNAVFANAGTGAIVAVNTVLPPIVIEIVDSANRVDSTNTAATKSTAVTVTSDDAAVVIFGSVAVARNGIVTFNNLMFTNCPSNAAASMKLTFTAGPELQHRTLVTGDVIVTCHQSEANMTVNQRQHDHTAKSIAFVAACVALLGFAIYTHRRVAQREHQEKKYVVVIDTLQQDDCSLNNSV